MERRLSVALKWRLDGNIWENADWQLRINADQRRERRDLVASGLLGSHTTL